MASQQQQDKHLHQKEEELKKIMADFYAFDMSELKRDMTALLKKEGERITKERDDKIREIQKNFKRIMGLVQDHVQEQVTQAKDLGQASDNLIEEFKRRNDEYESFLREVGRRKLDMRGEMTELEIELKKLREQLSEKRLENKGLEYVLKREEELRRKKEELEEKALLSITDDLQDQLNEMKVNAEQITGKVTPYGFEQRRKEFTLEIKDINHSVLTWQTYFRAKSKLVL